MQIADGVKRAINILFWMADDEFETESRRLRRCAIEVVDNTVHDYPSVVLLVDWEGAIFSPACELRAKGGRHLAFVQLHAQGGAVSVADGDRHDVHHLDDLPEAESLSAIAVLIRRVCEQAG